MTDSPFLTHQCLVAMPNLEGSYFEQALIYILEHNDEGAFGLAINKPIDVKVDEILGQLNPDYKASIYPEPVHIGGPVDNHRGFVLHRPGTTGSWEQQVNIDDKLAITSSADILQAMAAEQDVGEYLLVLGYSGWSAGQLEQEMARNSWLAVPVPIVELLKTPTAQRLNMALNQLGIHYAQLSGEAGHA